MTEARTASGNIVSTDLAYTFTVTRDHTLTAVFEKIPAYTITATIDPPEAGTVSGAGKYQEGETVTLKAVPADSYQFTGWQENGGTVSTEAEYTFTVTGNRELIAIFAVKISRLPDGYTELEYISVGNKCGFDTKYWSVPSKTKVVMDVQMNPYTNSYESIFGSVTSNGLSFFVRRDSASAIMCNVGTAKRLSTSLPSNRVTIDYNGPSQTISFGSTSFTVGVGTSVVSTNLYLFASYSGENNPVSKLYSAQVYKDGVLQRDLVPCKNPSGVIGLFDLVEGKLYKKSWSGTLAAGPAV